MNLKIYNQENSGSVKSEKRPQISVSRSGGTIRFNPATVQALGIVEGQRWILLQDTDKPKDWYIAQQIDGLRVRSYRKDTAHTPYTEHTIQSVLIAKTILGSLGIEGNSARFTLGIEPIPDGELSIYPIITASYQPKHNDENA